MYCYVDIFHVDVGVLVLLFVLCSFVVDEYHVSLRCIARLVAGCSCGMLSRMYKHANRCYMTDNTDYRKIYQTKVHTHLCNRRSPPDFKRSQYLPFTTLGKYGLVKSGEIQHYNACIHIQ